jgi:hypothetical protein
MLKRLLQYIARNIIFEMIDEKFVTLLANEFSKAVNVKVIDIAITEIKRLELKPGDIVVLRTKTILSNQEYERMRESVQHELFPNKEHKVMVLEEDMDIAVMSERHDIS